MMAYYIVKLIVSAFMIVLISEVAKRSSMLGGIFASIPLISVLAMIWLYHDTKDVIRVSSLATSVFWMVIPSLALFISFPFLIKKGIDFYQSMGISIIITVSSYYIMILLLRKLGVSL